MKYCYFFLLFLCCTAKQKVNNTFSDKNRSQIDKQVDSLASIIGAGNCVHFGATGFQGVSTDQLKAFEGMSKVASNEKLFALLKHDNPKIRFSAIKILHDRHSKFYFREGEKLLSNDTAMVCFTSGSSIISLPLNIQIKNLK